ncbi:MAG: heparinase II/III family protein [Planctomycetota bacterium]|nr:heparinase II/III family protein [Planctomycetota bacterium]MDP7249957.1 heparinase II/III family protein [Planctomycetota bacterium]
MKTTSSFYTPDVIERVRSNVSNETWASDVADRIRQNAEPWATLSDDELWQMMFGATINRSWMVWSDGHCPSCSKPVPMYQWVAEPMTHPWKLRCPRCEELFPKNDFQSFYQSGLDEHGVFDPERSDRTLLFNEDHPDVDDPLRGFGVDDGEGFVDGDKRWRFIGAYLIYGQWKSGVVLGIKNLAAAFLVSGELRYAHKAGILLDRVADLYPSFDFKEQAWMYENPGSAGYVSTWHDACEETREMSLAYDMVMEALSRDHELVEFLSRKAREFKIENPKKAFADIQRNIEERILRDAIQNDDKIRSNYPRKEIAVAMMQTVLDWPDCREEVLADLAEILERATAVDGVTGEKGLSNYSAFVIQALASFLGWFDLLEDGFISETVTAHPRLIQGYRFFIDTWCMQKYYPLVGDTGWFAGPTEEYRGVIFNPMGDESRAEDSFKLIEPSSFTFLWRLFEISGDADFARVLFHTRSKCTDGLQGDMFGSRSADVQRRVEEIVASEGEAIEQGSIHKEQWCLGILRSGQGEHARALWMHYDAGGNHHHADAMNVGLFAKGLDLMPDFGYPPVHFGGWSSQRANWYRMTAAHNTVVIDGKNQKSSKAEQSKATLWADEEEFHAIRAFGDKVVEQARYERTVALVDISETDFYIVDIFRVVGGSDHAKFFHSHFGNIAAEGLSLEPAEEFGFKTQMRGFQRDPAPKPGWSVEWKIEDRYGILPNECNVRLRYTDLTEKAEAWTCEGWVVEGKYNCTVQSWIPRVMVRRRSEEAPLASTFVSIIEPFERERAVRSIRRHTSQESDPEVVIELELTDGRSDIFIAGDPQDQKAGPVVVNARNGKQIKLEGEMALYRTEVDGSLKALASVGAADF